MKNKTYTHVHMNWVYLTREREKEGRKKIDAVDIMGNN
jgi:hypothetical protein